MRRAVGWSVAAFVICFALSGSVLAGLVVTVVGAAIGALQ